MIRIGMLFIASVMLVAGPAQAQEDRGSGKYLVPFCKAWLRMLSNDVGVIKNEFLIGSATPGGISKYFLLAGMCAGEVVGISELLNERDREPAACMPSDVTNKKLVQTVADFIEERPARSAEKFSVLARAAIAIEWPCQR